MQHHLGALADSGVNLLHRGDEVSEETDRIAIPLVEGKPGDSRGWGMGGLHSLNPLADQRGLAKAGWRRKERQLAFGKCMVKLLDQSWTSNKIGAGGRDVELGGQKRIGHRRSLALSVDSEIIERGSGFAKPVLAYSYVGTSRTVSRAAFRAGKKLALAERMATGTSQINTPPGEDVRLFLILHVKQVLRKAFAKS